MLSFSTEQHAIEGAIAFDDVDWIWASPRAAHDRAACDRATAITLGVDKALRRRRLRQRAALDERDMSHRTPAAAALRLTGERSGTAAMPSARAFANISSRHSAGSRQSRGKSRPLAHRRDGGHGDFLDRVEGGVSPSRASPMANPLLELSRASWTCATDRPAPSTHPA